ncbi:MAG: hypothetical protein VCA37_00140 [Roseibacillus sp.]
MRALLSVSAAALFLAMFTSCSSTGVTKADIAAFKLRDLTRFGQPHIVRISRKEVQALELSDLKSGRMASLDPRHQLAPVNFVPPHLPAGSVAFDGSILPRKTDGSSTLLDLPRHRYGAASYRTSIPQNFSIE